MLNFEFCIMTAISNISTQLNIIKTVLKAHIVISNNIDINIKFIYIMLKYLYNNLVSIYWFSSIDDFNNVLTKDSE